MNSNNVDYNLSIIYLRKTTDWLAQSYKKKEFLTFGLFICICFYSCGRCNLNTLVYIEYFIKKIAYTTLFSLFFPLIIT